ncbi:MAG: hypothetical protein CMQ43_10515 [Gammaproteobacteria bacterium]|jgi:hypothetical protein|nr:hypothetical protein [Gammaproteobacteria bacterium]MBK81327.1 hypothetical protein [Gammaproteobacteria bacterium]|tara:strand:- start:10121 stop:10378 length:258 start_codon:yes stop_codon:yes gene_type:complete
MAGAVISHVRVAAAHDGVAEMVVTLRHANGGLSDVTLDETGAAALFEACGSSTAEELIGHGWEKVQHALAVSWNRYAPLPEAPPS